MSTDTVLPVAVETPQHTAVSRPLSYRSEHALAPGTLVHVPLGKRTVPGLVWTGPADDPGPTPLRPLTAVLDNLPPLPPEWLALVEFAAGYYQRGVGELALSVLPPELRKLDPTQLARRQTRWARRRAPPDAAVSSGEPDTRPALSSEQAAALQQIEAAGAATTLLHGVTGSGKTEVYLRCVEQALQRGRQALVLVPEINLTPQLEARFQARFPAQRLVALHSRLMPAQRLEHWMAAHTGAADVVLGTRLAVFTPMPRLGLIVVDEEHDPSYKQQEGARYSARDLAVWLGSQRQVPVLLGSATPSLETWWRAQQGRYRVATLSERVGGGRTMPRLRVVDLGQLPRGKEGAPILAPQLVAALQQRLERGEQSLLLLNRRGYSPVLHCTACGWKSGCPHCSAWRVFHKIDRTLRCHHCGLAEAVPRACPDCGNLDVVALGRGTEKLQEQLQALLPAARIGRIDADSTRHEGALESQLAAVHAGDVDVLVGTQMVAKGHDFRRMTLVAAVNPDGALFSSDFRAAERLFALLMQAAGRAGRESGLASSSEMWLQTHHPRHPLYVALARHDFAAFAADLLAERQSSRLPPFSHLALLRADAKQAEVATAFLADASARAAEMPSAEPVTVYAPVPHPVAKVAGVERVQMLLESSSRPALQRFLAQWLPELHQLRARHRGLLRWALDVDPLSI